MALVRDSFVAMLSLGLASAVACTDLAPSDDADWDVVDDGKGDGPARALSFGELAASTIPAAFDAVVAGLGVIDDDVMPPEPKAVRKQIAALRDQVDLFCYAYPTSHGDPWQDIRDQLDEGYETIGAFKDLFDRQGVLDPAEATYDPDELEEHRAETIAWASDFLDEDLAEMRAYLAAPSVDKLHDRDRDDLSPFFWGATDIEPSKRKSGLKNIARLARELLDLAKDDYTDVLDLRDLHEHENQEHFHDFRKRVRGVVRTVGFFPEIVDPEEDVTDVIAALTEAVDRYGALNDLLSRYVADPDDDLEDQIAAEWKTLRTWQKDLELDELLDELHDALRH